MKRIQDPHNLNCDSIQLNKLLFCVCSRNTLFQLYFTREHARNIFLCVYFSNTCKIFDILLKIMHFAINFSLGLRVGSFKSYDPVIESGTSKYSRI